MVTNYEHHMCPRQSEFIKYRGKTGQIDVKDTILGILSKLPGSTKNSITDLIYPGHFRMSRRYNIPSALGALVRDGLITMDSGGFFYLLNDAVSHDITKTHDTFNTLLAKGLTPEQITFLSSGVLMAAENAIAESRGENYNPKTTSANSPVEVPKKVEPVVVPEPVNQIDTEQAPSELLKEDAFDNVEIPNPFNTITEEDLVAIKDSVELQFHLDAEAEKAEEQRRLMEIQDTIARGIKEKAEEELLCKEVARQNEYKNRLASIKKATDILGLDVEILMPEISGQVVGTILEVYSDSVLFLIVFSNDTLFQEGSIHTLFYKDKLSYKIR